MTIVTKRNLSVVITAILAAAMVLAALQLFGPDKTGATHQPANKMAVAASALDTATLSTSGAPATATISILGPRTIKTNNVTDLVIQVTAESALWTNVKAGLLGDSTAFAQAKIFVTLDGAPVPVSSDDTVAGDIGEVVFNDRTFQVKTYFLTGACVTDPLCIELFLRTRSANAFNWVVLNVGQGVHEIEVWAELNVSVAGSGLAEVLVGKRSLVVEPAKLASDILVVEP